MEVKVNGEFTPRQKDYSKYYTPLLRVKLTAEQMTFNGIKGTFIVRIFRSTTDQLRYKDIYCYFGMASNVTQTPKILLHDLTPDVQIVHVVAEIKDNYCYLYAKGGNSSDTISCQLLYAPYKSFIEILDDENLLVADVVNPINPTYLVNTLSFNIGWSATSSKQRVINTQYGYSKLDYFISTTDSNCTNDGYIVGTLNLKPKYNKSFYCMWISKDGMSSGICEMEISRATNNIICKTNVPTNAYIHLDVEYQLDAS